MLDGYKNVQEWRIWTQGGARQERQCRFGGGMLRMWSVGCGMLDVEWGMRHGNVLPQIADLFAGGEGFIMWSVENVECGVLNESRWMRNGFKMGSMGRRGCVFTVQKVITVSKNARQWGVWNARNLIFVAKKGAPITARHDDRQGGRGKSGSSMTGSIR